MDENPFGNKPPEPKPSDKAEQLDIKVELATIEDWEAYKKLRLMALTGPDKAMFGAARNNVEEEKLQDEDFWKEYLDSKVKFVVLAWHNDEPVGFGRAKETSPTVWRMNSGYVVTECQGKGVGRKLFRVRLEEIKRRGGKIVEALVSSRNKKSLSLALSEGFREASKLELAKVLKNPALLFNYKLVRLDLTKK